jgi:hypothetical protein
MSNESAEGSLDGFGVMVAALSCGFGGSGHLSLPRSLEALQLVPQLGKACKSLLANEH